ncbi:hypothetical protein SAMN04488503_1799 [Humidesulfovibrio mexicanus]|uniref:ATPase domain-containing protein n=1 Tax=Humidesulfovibrio mexicanus TaxID=147047 RepID=A0A239A575_9BACT|nr:ATP-binding protein [Humidesulfovibrio mexicanus]SNR90043.1 hypothetical protein SAMN04488503_1799 [Humidesulfovibrio mexicanus]
MSKTCDDVHSEVDLASLHPRAKSVIEKVSSSGFRITRATKIISHRTEITVAFLSPSDHIKELFSLEYELLMVYNKFETLEPRTFQAIDRYMSSLPAKGRVESTLYLLVSENKDPESWVASYMLEHKDEKVVIPLRAQAVLDQPVSHVLKEIEKNYFAVNKFKDNLPIESDVYFFGREKEINKAVESYQKKENTGVFGLRKTGKTSLLLKLQRQLESAQVKFLLVQLQDTANNMLRWNGLIEKIAQQLQKNRHSFSETEAGASFAKVVGECERSGIERIVIMFDEIEQITPPTAAEKHWAEDYRRFFQTIRSFQTSNRNLSIMVAGLSSLCSDIDRFEGQQNPLFGIINQIYLKGFSESETSNMIKKLSKVSGSVFDNSAITFLYRSYGGHPLLTRLACAYELEHSRKFTTSFPSKITANAIQGHASTRDRELVFYINHVISELSDYYPEEYKLLESLALGEYVYFVKTTKSSSAGRYLYLYGIVSNEGDSPYITVDVVAEYLAIEDARKHDRPTFYPVVPADERTSFVQTRVEEIIADLRGFEKRIKNKDCAPLLFGPNSFPYADRLTKIAPPVSWDDFDKNIDPLHLAFVESIDAYGKSIGDNNYFWTTIKSAYPVLHKALVRVRMYRINSNHLNIKKVVNDQLDEFLAEDLAGTGEEIPDKFWVLFQRVLDELFRAIQFEDSRLK